MVKISEKFLVEQEILKILKMAQSLLGPEKLKILKMVQTLLDL
jgi:hypothetical protein